MGIGVSLVLMAVGAILLWAVNVTTKGIDLDVVGVILLVLGAVGLLLSLAFWSSWGAWRPVRRDVVERDDGRTVYTDRY